MARQAIVTKYIGPTDFRGSRVKATADAGSITVSWDHALNIEDNHERAALALVVKYGWLDVSQDPALRAVQVHGVDLKRSTERALKLFRKRYAAGGMPQKGNPYAYVYVDREDGR